MTQRAGAFFDVDGTLTRSDIVRDFVAFRRESLQGAARAAFDLTLPARAVAALAVDAVSRTAVNRLTYGWYRGASRHEFTRWAETFQGGPGLARLLPRAFDLVRRHAALGHRLVLVSGSVDLLLAPLVRLLEARLATEGAPGSIRLEAVRLAESGGAFTGAMVGAPLGGDEKARRIRGVAQDESLDLRASFAYGDSIADLPMLLAVGRPAAASPDRRLRREARRRGWPVLDLGAR